MGNKFFGVLVVIFFAVLLVPGCQPAWGESTVLYLPLDNRPMNYANTVSLGEAGGVEVLTPPAGVVGEEKECGDVNRLWAWLEENIHRADACIISSDMLLYGGLVPSRTHHREMEDVLAGTDRLGKLLAGLDKPVYVFGTIMRSAASSASQEQPAYFARYGDKILQLSGLSDLHALNMAFPAQVKEMQEIKNSIPAGFLNDYLQRREINLKALKEIVRLTGEGLIDYLILGRDDCSPYGFTRMDLREVNRLIDDYGMRDRVEGFPGADELGAVLLARAVSDIKDRAAPRVYIHWATENREAIAVYEDIPLSENVQRHVRAIGGTVVNSPVESDIILAVNNPPGKVGRVVSGAGDGILPQEYHLELARKVAGWARQGKTVVLADVAFANGSDPALMEALAREKVLPRLAGYAGCNTAGNSIGIALAQGLIYHANKDELEQSSPPAHHNYLLQSLLEDWGFQALVRPRVIQRYALDNAGTVLDGELRGKIEQEVQEELNVFARDHLNGQFDRVVGVKGLRLPWHRLFEVEFDIYGGTLRTGICPGLFSTAGEEIFPLSRRVSCLIP